MTEFDQPYIDLEELTLDEEHREAKPRLAVAEGWVATFLTEIEEVTEGLTPDPTPENS